jgi:hypothetical protein
MRKVINMMNKIKKVADLVMRKSLVIKKLSFKILAEIIIRVEILILLMTQLIIVLIK